MTAAARDSSDHTAYSMAYSHPHANMPATCCLHDEHRMTQGVSFCAWKLHLAASVLPDSPSAGCPHRPCKLTGQVPVSDKRRALTAAHREAVLTFRHCATHCFRACIDSVRMHNVGGGPTPTAGPMISGTRQRQYRDQRMRSGAEGTSRTGTAHLRRRGRLKRLLIAGGGLGQPKVSRSNSSGSARARSTAITGHDAPSCLLAAHVALPTMRL